MKLIEKLLRELFEELTKERNLLVDTFHNYHEFNNFEQYKQLKLKEEQILRQYKIKDIFGVSDRLVEIDNAISYLNTRFYFDFDSKKQPN